MTRAVSLILTLLLAAFLSVSDGWVMEGLAGPNCNDSACYTKEPDVRPMFVVAYGNDPARDSAVEPAVENAEDMTSDAASQNSRTGRLIMTLLLITLTLIGLSIMPIILISHASRIRKQQELAEKNNEKPSD